MKKVDACACGLFAAAVIPAPTVVIPAKAGIHLRLLVLHRLMLILGQLRWIPAFAGMTVVRVGMAVPKYAVWTSTRQPR
jgi:hypothetical protein